MDNIIMQNEDLFGIILGGILIFLLVFLVIAIAVYICQGLAYYKAGELENIDNKWLAWIPVGSNYIMLKLGNKNTNYIWLFVGSFILSIISNFIEYDNPLGLVVTLAIVVVSIWGLVISIQSYIAIGKKYSMSCAWFIVGLFIPPVLIVAFIILYNKATKISRGEASLNVQQ